MQILIDIKNIVCEGWGWGCLGGVRCGIPTADEFSLPALPLKTNPGMRFQFSQADYGVPLLPCGWLTFGTQFRRGGGGFE